MGVRFDPKVWRVAGVVLLAPLITNLDATVVNVALSTIREDLHASIESVQWTVSGYLLALALMLALVGLLATGGSGLVPCTPLGIMRLLGESGVELRGAHAVVVGRSHLVGRPVAGLLLAADATVTLCHSRTRDLPARVAEADVVVAALGRPEAIRGDWIKPGAVVIDVGINRRPDGRVVGDVEFAAARARASAITPVPGGVGPMTIAMLLQNTVRAAASARPTPADRG